MSTLRNRHKESRITLKRLILVSAVFILFYTILIIRLYQLQITEHTHYQRLADKNKNREIHIAPFRGDIIDKHGEPLATYSTRFILKVDHLTDKDKQTLLQLGIPITNLSQYTLTAEQFAYLNNYPIAGTELLSKPYRYYPLGSAAAHLIGYTGTLHSKSYRFDHPVLEGKSGIEKAYQTYLLGNIGLQRQHINAKGTLFNTNILKEPQRSNPLSLTIDARLQRFLHDIMIGHTGSVVVLNPNNGQLLAAVSSPSYDPNKLISDANIDKEGSPMFNRLSQAVYSPGSTIKPFIALGALDDHLLEPDTFIDDPGYYKLNENSRQFNDHKRTGHGKVNLHKAIVVSCDTYFYQLSHKLGIDRLTHYLSRYKLGQKTGLFPNESTGIIPTKDYREKHYKKWYQGHTIITGIGQGDLLVTPLQLARATMLLANNGYDYPLTYIATPLEETAPMIEYQRDHREYILSAMEEVALNGTARKIGKKPYSVALKTGSIQVVQLDDKSKYHQLPLHQKDHHMIIGFAPSHEANIAFVVTIEHQHEATNITNKILNWCYQHGYIVSHDTSDR